MPPTKGDYVSDIWKDGIFGKCFGNSLVDVSHHAHLQTKRWFSAQAGLAQSAVLRFERWFTSEQTLAL